MHCSVGVKLPADPLSSRRNRRQAVDPPSGRTIVSFLILAALVLPFPLSASALDEPPVNSVPESQTVDEDTDLLFSSGAGNAIGVSDPDAGLDPVKVSLAAGNGVLTLGAIASLDFSPFSCPGAAGDGVEDAAMTFCGILADINSALEGLVYRGTLNYYGADILTVTSDDQGHSGPGDAFSDTDEVPITVDSVNDPPVPLKDDFFAAMRTTDRP